MRRIVNEYLPWLAGINRDDVEMLSRIKARGESHPIRCAKQGTKAELLIYEQIGLDWWTGEGFTPARLQDEINRVRPFNELVVKINSPGGDVFDGMAIFNVLRSIKETVSVEIEGLAASAASYIAQAASRGQLKIHETAQAMVHNAMGGLMIFDNADAIERDSTALVALLRKIDQQIADVYAARSGRPANDWAKLMNAETFLTGKQAVAEKFADVLIPLEGGGKKNQAWKNRIDQMMLDTGRRIS